MQRTVWDGDQALWEIAAPGQSGSGQMQVDTGLVGRVQPQTASPKLVGSGGTYHVGRVLHVFGGGLDDPHLRKPVKVYWVSPQAGGRTEPFAGNRYSTIARFPEDAENWPDEAWSIVVEFEPPPSQQGNPSFGAASFLVEDAPLNRLRAGRVFELFEGHRMTALVEVLVDE